MLKDKPIKLNGMNILTPLKWTESFSNVETINETEAGTKQIMVTRRNRRTVEAQFRCTSEWLNRLSALNNADLVHAEYSDVLTGFGVEYDMHITEYKADFIYHSEESEDTDGVWNISLKMEAI